MIKLLVSELRAKDLVSPRYDSRKIVPGAQHEVNITYPDKWTKRTSFRIAGKFVSITQGFHEALARVHADAIRRISGTWETWDQECTNVTRVLHAPLHEN